MPRKPVTRQKKSFGYKADEDIQELARQKAKSQNITLSSRIEKFLKDYTKNFIPIK